MAQHTEHQDDGEDIFVVMEDDLDMASQDFTFAEANPDSESLNGGVGEAVFFFVFAAAFMLIAGAYFGIVGVVVTTVLAAVVWKCTHPTPKEDDAL